MIYPDKRKLTILTFLIGLLTVHSQNIQSVEIVQLQLNYENAIHTMDIELFDDIAPFTVANYLDYVTSLDADNLPKYNDSFITVNIPSLILQTGGYTFRPNSPDDALITVTGIASGLDKLKVVPKGSLSPVINEFNRSNLRGTIGMAKVPASFVEGGSCVDVGPDCTLVEGTGPNSATTQWYINLSDNLEFDTKNGGFTVFGEVIDDGIIIADEMSSFPNRPFAGAALGNSDFNNLPVANYDINANPFPDLLKENLIIISTTTQITRPILRFNPNKAIFSLDVAGDGIDKSLNVIVTNTGNEALTISSINGPSLNPPFSIVTDCSNGTTLNPVALDPDSSCAVNYMFSPTVEGDFSDILSINYASMPSGIPYSVSVNTSGEGVPQTPVLFASETPVQFEDTLVNTTSKSIAISVRNKGGNPLVFTALDNIIGNNNSDFSVTSTTCSLVTALQLGETCEININFQPIISGDKTAELALQSNGGNATIPLLATATIPTISVDSTFNILNTVVGQTKGKILTIENTGTATLILNTAVISGLDASFFTQENTCPNTKNIDTEEVLNPGRTCRFLIRFTPTDEKNRIATLTIESSDPVTPSVNITLNGTGAIDDTDGIPSSVESAAPNAGDGNNDNIPDKIQDNVASLVAASSDYITFASDNSVLLDAETSLIGVSLIDPPLTNIPADSFFKYGLYKYSVSLPTGDGVNVAIFLPLDAKPDTFYKFGPTIDNTEPHWYNFSYNAETLTGARFLGKVKIQSTSGKSVERNLVLVSYIDGQNGDDDLIANSIILNEQSGLSFSNKTSSSGSWSPLSLLVLLLINIYRYRYQKLNSLA